MNRTKVGNFFFNRKGITKRFDWIYTSPPVQSPRPEFEGPNYMTVTSTWRVPLQDSERLTPLTVQWIGGNGVTLLLILSWVGNTKNTLSWVLDNSCDGQCVLREYLQLVIQYLWSWNNVCDVYKKVIQRKNSWNTPKTIYKLKTTIYWNFVWVFSIFIYWTNSPFSYDLRPFPSSFLSYPDLKF